jgi:hypothetical protein
VRLRTRPELIFFSYTIVWACAPVQEAVVWAFLRLYGRLCLSQRLMEHGVVGFLFVFFFLNV